MRNSILLESIISYLQVLRLTAKCEYIRHVRVLFRSINTAIIIPVEFGYPHGYTLPLKNYTGCVVSTCIHLTTVYIIYDYFKYVTNIQSNKITQ